MMLERQSPVDDRDQAELARARAVRKYSGILSEAAGWMKLIAVVSALSSIVTVIGTWWTVFFMWIPVWSAVLLFRASTETRQASESGTTRQFESALGRLRLYFKISGIVSLLSLVMMVLSLFVSIPIMTAQL